MSKFGGTTLSPEDEPRLNQQLSWVWEILVDGQWHTIMEIERTIQHKYNYTMQTSVSARIRDFRKTKFGGHTVEKMNIGKGLWQYRLVVRRKPVTFNLGERIKQVRLIEAKMGAMEEEFDAKVKPLKDWAVAARAEILKYLLDTGQKSANTEYGGVHWKEKVTYRVEDKDEYRRHVIGTEQWELLSWAAAGVACEEYTKEHGVPPPGTVRNGVILPYITAPTKKPTKVSKANGANAPMPEGGDFWEAPTNPQE